MMNKSKVKKAVYIMVAMGILCTSSSPCVALVAPKPPEYPNLHLKEIVRIEPTEGNTYHTVSFMLNDRFMDDPYFALKGKGIGKDQWPLDPSRENYTFIGWYDNVERQGNPYSQDTPIYEDTALYAKWKYSGSGWCWPRPHRGDIRGIEEGESINVNQPVSFTVGGYNMNLVAPKDQRFRWIPTLWKISNSTNGVFSKEAPFLAEFSLSKEGEYKIYITYEEEIFDGVDWQKTRQIHEVEELFFLVN